MLLNTTLAQNIDSSQQAALAQSPDILAALRRSLQQQQLASPASPVSSHPSLDLLPPPQVDFERILEAKNEELKLAGEYGLELLANCKRADDRNAELELLVRTLREESKELTRSALRHERDLRNLERSQAELSSELEAKDAEIARLTRALQKALRAAEERSVSEAKIDALAAEVATARELEAETKRENLRLTEKIAGLEAMLKDAETAEASDPLEKAETFTTPSHTELEVLFALATELQLANAKLRTDLDAAELLRQRNETLQRDLEETQSLLANLRNEMDMNRRVVSSPIAIAGTSISSTVRKSVFGELEDVVIRNTPPASTWQGRPLDDVTTDSRPGSAARQASSAYVPPSPSIPSPSPSSLNEHVQELTRISLGLHQKLTTTDPHHLNRKLRRRFDIAQLSALSQTVIDNIQTGIQDLPNTFAAGGINTPITDSAAGSHHPIMSLQKDVYSHIFLPLVRLIQGLLEDLCRVKGTLNEYALMYFEKISERAAGSCLMGSRLGDESGDNSTRQPRTSPPLPRRPPSQATASPPPRRAIQHQQMHREVQHQHIEMLSQGQNGRRFGQQSSSELVMRPTIILTSSVQQAGSGPSPVPSPVSPTMRRSATAPAMFYEPAARNLLNVFPSAERVAGWFAPPQSEANRGPVGVEGGRFGTQPILDSARGSAARRVERVRQHADEALRAVSASSQTGPLPPPRPRDAHVVAYQDNTTRRRAEVQAAALRDENPNSVAPLTISPITWSGLPNYAPSPPRRRVDMRFKDPTNILNSLVLSEPSSPRGDARKIRSDIGSLPRYEPGEGTVSQWLASSALQPNVGICL
ncbi:hypothetical protein HDU88_005563 [Geranomyces variabilis]|nr:hypothetical protein HDU88_005563 [Geranomyces variabilis]